MGRIFCLMGKSSSGKDTLYARLSEKLHFSTIVPYTTRPIREGEELPQAHRLQSAWF